MKKILLLLILAYGQLFALDRDSTLKMYHGIFSALSPKPLIAVYTNDEEYKEVFKTSKRILLSNEAEEADIVLITDEATLKSVLRRVEVSGGNRKTPILFVTNYRFLEKSEDIIGAFYWRKGRSQLLFIKKRLDRQHIALPEAYKKFMIDQL